VPTPTQEESESLAPDAAGTILSAEELREGDRVVYPKQGVCRVAGRQVKEIGGMKLEFVSLVREEDSASILVPVDKVPTVGLRKLADTAELGDVFDLLASSFDDPELDWKVRHRLHGDLLAAGGILGVAEVLKGLQALANIRPLPQKERERYDAARHLLVDEVAVALGVPHATAEDYIDLALIPPPGVVRPPSKPRRLATLPPKPKRPAPRRPVAEEEELELGLDEELDLEEELPEEELEGEEAAEGEAPEEIEEEEAPAPAKKPRRAPAKKPAPAKAAKPAEERAKKPAPRRKAVEGAATGKGDAKKAPAKAPAKKEAVAAAPKAEKKEARKAPAKKAKPAATKPAAAKAPAKSTAKKPPARKTASKAEPAAAKKAPARTGARKTSRSSRSE